MAMQFLVICRPAAGGDPEEFTRLVPFETEKLRELAAAGTLTGAWNPGRPGAVLMLEAADEDETASLIATLPLVQADLITTEIIPLHPIDLRGPQGIPPA
jgi:muconolactone delta-isomerase